MRIIPTLLAMLIATTTPALAQPVNATYGLYTGGVRMIDVNATLNLGAKNYAMRTEAATIGVFTRLLPWQGIFDTRGGANYQPLKHDYTVNWRRDTETLRFDYASPGKLTSVTEIKGDSRTDKTPDDAGIYQGARDILSAMGVLLQQYEKTGSCNADTKAFDGKRSLIVQSRDAGTAHIDNPRLSIYSGPAHGCTIKIIPDKGPWPQKPRGWIKIQQMGESQGRLPVIWLAHPENTPHPIPVRIDIHTKYGNVIAHLRALN